MKKSEKNSSARADNSPALPNSNRDRGLSAALLLALAAGVITMAVNWPAISARAAMFDDSLYLNDNDLVQTPSWQSARQFLVEVTHPSTVGGYYQPLSMISLMLDFAMGGRPDNLAPFHVTSLVIHALNTMLVVLLLYALFRRAAIAGLVGLLFGVHPINVESFVWLSERKTVLGTFFALAALLCYVRYARLSRETGGPSTSVNGRGIGYFLVCTGLFILALLSKPTTVPLPLCMLLMDLWPLARFNRRAVMEKIPLMVMSVVSAAITFISQRNTAIVTRPTDYPAMGVPLIVSHNIVFYMRKLIWPWPLTAYHAFPRSFSLAEPAYLIGIVGSMFIVATLIYSARRNLSWLIGWLIFFVAIFPTLGVVGFTEVIAADRFVYLPMVGLLMWLTCWLGTRRREGVVLVIGLCVSAVFAFSSRNYIDRWKESTGLMRYMLQIAPRAPGLHIGLGSALELQKQLPEAIEEYKLAVQFDPSATIGHYHLGHALYEVGRLDEAAVELREALRIRPDEPVAHIYLGLCLAQQGKNDEAELQMRRAIELRGWDSKTHSNLGTFLAKNGRGEEAVDYFQRALAIKPASVAAQYNLGLTLFQLGRIDEAAGHFNEALRFGPPSARAFYQLACMSMVQGREGVAEDYWRRALEVEPGYIEAMADLAWVLATSDQASERNGAEALRWAQRACEMTNNSEPVLLDVLAAAQAETGRASDAVATQQRAIEAATKRSGGALALGARTITLREMQARLKVYQAGQAFHEKIDYKKYQPAKPPRR